MFAPMRLQRTRNKKKRKGRLRVGIAEVDDKWPEHALVFDTETRITADQSLTFRRISPLFNSKTENTQVTKEGIFYADDLPAKDRRVLKTIEDTAISDVPSFPPKFPMHTRSEFIKKIFYPAMKRNGALICGLNLPFDLSSWPLPGIRAVRALVTAENGL